MQKKKLIVASTAIKNTVRLLLPQYKTDYPSEISEDSCQSSGTSMVETSLTTHIKEEDLASSPSYLSTAMLLSTQNCAYFGQRLSNLHHERRVDKQSENTLTSHQLFQQQQKQLGTVPTSLFTIDSILASKTSQSGSPSSSPTQDLHKPGSNHNSNQASPRSTRVSTMLHPGLHLSHLAAAANFGAPSDFLGKV